MERCRLLIRLGRCLNTSLIQGYMFLLHIKIFIKTIIYVEQNSSIIGYFNRWDSKFFAEIFSFIPNAEKFNCKKVFLVIYLPVVICSKVAKNKHIFFKSKCKNLHLLNKKLLLMMYNILF